MNGTANPPIRDQRSADIEHLNLLSILHFVGAGLAVLGLMFLFAHFSLVRIIMTDPKFSGNDRPPAAFFAIIKFFYVFIGFWYVASGVLNVASALCLRSRKNRTFSQVVAVINCLHIPLGTILGVFTLIALNRESVRSLYQD